MTASNCTNDFRAKAEALFDHGVMSELAKMLRLTDPDKAAAFRAALIEMCAYYREIIATLPCDLPDAPCNLSLTKRADWLEANVINPIDRLKEALEDDKRPMFSPWPYPLSAPVFRDNQRLLAELQDVAAQAVQLRDSLRQQQADDAGHSQELRAEIFIAVARLLREHCPNVPPNRGVYDRELGRRSGRYVDAIRLIFSKIAGVNDNLDRLIRQEIHLPS